MKVLFLVLVSLCGAESWAQDAEVQKTIETFFNAMKNRDTIAINSVISEKLILQTVAQKMDETKVISETAADFKKQIAEILMSVSIEERILSYDIKIDGNLASVWAPYEFYINGNLSHRGANSLQLVKDLQGWKIVYIIDTRRK